MKWIPRILSRVFLWGAVAGVVVYVEPELLRDIIIPGSYLPFFVLLEIALWHTTQSFWIATTIVLGVILSIMQLMHWGLAVALLLTLVIESWYIYLRHEKINTTDEHKN